MGTVVEQKELLSIGTLFGTFWILTYPYLLKNNKKL